MLQLTRFHVEKLRNIVGIGNTAAYQIIVTPDQELGRIGKLDVPESARAANQPVGKGFANRSPAALLRRAVDRWRSKR
jgi:hypothetical protein